jgi:hypothetical protein
LAHACMTNMTIDHNYLEIPCDVEKKSIFRLYYFWPLQVHLCESKIGIEKHCIKTTLYFTKKQFFCHSISIKLQKVV